MKYYSEFVTYWTDMRARVAGLRGVSIGSDAELIDLQAYADTYPHLRVSTPTMNVTGSGVYRMVRYQTTLYVLVPVRVADYNEQHAVLSQADLLIRAVYALVVADADADQFDLVQGAQGDAIEQYSADNLSGWYLDVAIEVPMADCGDVNLPPVSDVVTGPTYSVSVPAGRLLLAVRTVSDAAQSVRVGTTSGGDQIGAASGAANDPLMFAGLQVEGPALIHLSGLQGSNQVRVWLA